MSQEDFEQMLLMTMQNTAAYWGVAEELEDFNFDLVLEYLQNKYVEDDQHET
jgi:hypothetical protein